MTTLTGRRGAAVTRTSRVPCSFPSVAGGRTGPRPTGPSNPGGPDAGLRVVSTVPGSAASWSPDAPWRSATETPPQPDPWKNATAARRPLPFSRDRLLSATRPTLARPDVGRCENRPVYTVSVVQRQANGDSAQGGRPLSGRQGRRAGRP